MGMELALDVGLDAHAGHPLQVSRAGSKSQAIEQMDDLLFLTERGFPDYSPGVSQQAQVYQQKAKE